MTILAPSIRWRKRFSIADKAQTHSGADEERTAPITADWPALKSRVNSRMPLNDRIH